MGEEMIDFEKYDEAAQAIEHDILVKELRLARKEYGVYAPIWEEPPVYHLKIGGRHGVCAIGCYLLGREAIDYLDYDEVESAAIHLGVPRAWVEGVVQGFDGFEDNLGRGGYEEAVAFRHGYHVGWCLREKYLRSQV